MKTLTLLEALGSLPDPRDRRGRRHSLTAILSLAVVATLAGMKSLDAIAQFGRDHGKALAPLLGFRRFKTPTKSTFSIVFRMIDVAVFEAILRRWLAARHAEVTALAIDGKTLRGSASGEVPGVHLLTAFAPQAAAVLGQLRVASTTNEHKAALQLLGVLPLNGVVVTGDAMFTHRDLCETVRARHGDYLLPVKDNQATLQMDIRQALTDDPSFSPYQQQHKRATEQTATSLDKGHGRIERRRLTSTTALNDYLDWPDVGQVFLLRRERIEAGKTTVEEICGITSLTREQADAKRLLQLTRGHWAIENRLFGVRDVTLGEDACRVRSGSAPQVLAGIRNVVIHLLASINASNKAAALRRFAARPREAIKLLFT